MSLGNLGASMNLMQGLVASNFLTSSNQGVAQFPDAVRDVIARADFPSTQNVKVKYVVGTTGANASPASVDTSVAALYGVVAYNAHTATQWLQIQDSTTVRAVLEMPPSSQIAVEFMDGLAPTVPTLGFVSTITSFSSTTNTQGAKVTTLWVYSI